MAAVPTVEAPLPVVISSIDQFLALVGQARGHRDPARWLEDRLLEMRHAILLAERIGRN